MKQRQRRRARPTREIVKWRYAPNIRALLRDLAASYARMADLFRHVPMAMPAPGPYRVHLRGYQRSPADPGSPTGDMHVEVPPLDAATQAKISEAVRQRLPPPMTSADPAHVPPPITLADLKHFITRP